MQPCTPRNPRRAREKETPPRSVDNQLTTLRSRSRRNPAVDFQVPMGCSRFVAPKGKVPSLAGNLSQEPTAPPAVPEVPRTPVALSVCVAPNLKSTSSSWIRTTIDCPLLSAKTTGFEAPELSSSTIKTSARIFLESGTEFSNISIPSDPGSFVIMLP